MKKVMALLSTWLIGATALAQSSIPALPANDPVKNNHGQTVSNAAHQSYQPTEKGYFVSRIARLNKLKNAPGKRVKAAGLPKNKVVAGKMRPKPQRVNPVPPQKQADRSLMVKSTQPRPGRANRPTSPRRPSGNGRFSHLGRG